MALGHKDQRMCNCQAAGPELVPSHKGQEGSPLRQRTCWTWHLMQLGEFFATGLMKGLA